MRIIVSVILITLSCSYTFNDYAIEFNKTYSSSDEKAARELLFNQRIAYYEQFNT